MPFYIYKAKIAPYKTITGTIEANSEQEVIARHISFFSTY